MNVITEALAAGGPQLVSVKVGVSWAAIGFMAGLAGIFFALIALNYKRPDLFAKLMSAMSSAYLTCHRAAMSMVISIKTFKAQRKAEQAAKVIVIPPVTYTPPPNEKG